MGMIEIEREAALNLIPGLPDDIALDCLCRVPHQFHPLLRRISRQWRDLLADPQFRRRRDRIGSAEDLIFMVQSQSNSSSKKPPPSALAVYNATLDSWYRAAGDCPMFAQCAAAGNRLVLLGGWDPETLAPVPGVRVLDPGTGAWAPGAPMGAPRSFFGCAAAGTRVYVSGGHDEKKNALKSAEAYDVTKDEWSALAEMAEERDECRGVVAGGRYLAVSGYGTEGQGRFGTSAERYDEEEGAWTRVEGEFEGGATYFSGGVGEGRMWCVDCGGGGGRRRGVREWLGEEKGWREVGTVPEKLKSTTHAVAIGGGGGERVFVTGADGEGRHAAWLMDVGSGRWSEVDTPDGFTGFVYSATTLRV